MEVVSTSWSGVITTGTLGSTINESNVEEHIKNAVQLIHDERCLAAEELLEKIRKFCREVPQGSYLRDKASPYARALSRLDEYKLLFEQCRWRAVTVKATLELLRQPSMGHDGWKVVTKRGGITTSFRDSSEGPRIRVEGQLSGSIFAQLAVLRETQLYHLWFPYCTESRLLGIVPRPETASGVPGEPGRLDLVSWLRMETPFVELDTCFRVYAADCTTEHGCVVMCGNSVGQFEVKSVDIPPVDESRPRLLLKEFKARIDVVNPTTTRVNVVVQVDPQLKRVPSSVAHFLLKRLAGRFLSALQTQAEIVAVESNCPHAEAIRQKPAFYKNWLLPKFDLYFNDKGWDTPPVVALNMDKGGQAGDRGRMRTNWSADTGKAAAAKSEKTTDSDLSEFLGKDELKSYQEAYREWKDKREKLDAGTGSKQNIKRRPVDFAIDSHAVPIFLAVVQCLLVDLSGLRWGGGYWLEAVLLLGVTVLGIVTGWHATFSGMQRVHHRRIGTFSGTFKKARFSVGGVALGALLAALLLSFVLTTWEVSRAPHLAQESQTALWASRMSDRMHVYSSLLHVLSSVGATGCHIFFKKHL